MDHLALVSDAYTLLDRADALLLDAYGVFWDGKGLYPGTLEFLEHCQQRSIPTVILSNTTRLSQEEEVRYAKHGVQRDRHYTALVTSGEHLRNELCRSTTLPRRVHVLFGNSSRYGHLHRALFAGLLLEEVESPEASDWIYLSVPQHDGCDVETVEPLMPLIERIATAKKPVVVGNPDLKAPEGNPPRWVVRQGLVAQELERLGCEVRRFGKPAPEIFEHALSLPALQGISKDRILMIGDTPETDIRGANQVGILSGLVLETGKMATEQREIGALAQASYYPSSDQPTWFLRRLARESGLHH